MGAALRLRIAGTLDGSRGQAGTEEIGGIWDFFEKRLGEIGGRKFQLTVGNFGHKIAGKGADETGKFNR